MSQPTKLYFHTAGTPLPDGWESVQRPLEVDYRHGAQVRNATHSYRGFANAIKNPPSAEIEDLHRIVSAVYIADLWITRSPDVAPDGWTRTFSLNIPVLKPTLWESDQVLNTLTQLLHFLTSDRWGLHFRQGRPQDWQPVLSGESATAVALFSGGLDSYSYAAARLNSSQPKVHLVGHTMPPGLGALQHSLVRTLTSQLQLTQFKVQVNRFKPHRANEPTQRTRSLLFMAAGLLLCSSNQIESLTVPENGLLAVNPPLTPARSGACMTKSVHPTTLYLLNNLLREINSPHRIDNPYRHQTKGEVCSEAIERGNISLSHLAETVTCSRPASRRGRGLANCGYCYACLVRHASLIAAGGDLTDYRDAKPGQPADMSERQRGDWLALQDWLSRDFTIHDLIAGSRFPPGTDLGLLVDVIRRSRKELVAAFA